LKINFILSAFCVTLFISLSFERRYISCIVNQSLLGLRYISYKCDNKCEKIF